MRNKISALLGKIQDKDLKAALESEISLLKVHKKFGLVFEHHRPEVLPLPERVAKRGDYVAMRGGPVDDLSKVLSVRGEKANVVKQGSSDEEFSSEIKEVSLRNLIVTKRFGDSIFPALKLMDELSGDGWEEHARRNVLIEADNFHALQLLKYIYAAKVDCIYIDPPYNTGARDWKYNNDYVDLNDSWRHSKWLSFMQRRLLLARDLLNPMASTLIVTIDEHEIHHLVCLLDEIFPSARRQIVTIVNNAAGVSQGGFYRVEEYAIFCFLGEARPVPGFDDMLSDTAIAPSTPYWFSLIRYGGVNAVPSKRDNLVYPIAIDPKTLKIVGVGPSLRDRVMSGAVERATDDWLPDPREDSNGYPVVWPFRGNGKMATWQVQPDTLLELQKEGFLRVRPHKSGPGGNKYSISYVKSGNRAKVASGEIPIIGREDSGAYILGQSARNVIPKTVWRRPRHDAGKWGSRVLRETLGEVAFDYAKSPYAVLDCLHAAVGNNPKALIVDFFAGSGTTMLGTLLLNERDNGDRRCVLVTNNEVSQTNAEILGAMDIYPGDQRWESKGVCRSVTWPRVQNTLRGASLNGAELGGSYVDPKLTEREVDREVVQLGFADGASLTAEMRKGIVRLLSQYGTFVQGKDAIKDYFFSKDKKCCVLFDNFETFGDIAEDWPELETIYVVTTNRAVVSAVKGIINEELGPLVIATQTSIPAKRGFAAAASYFKLEFLEPGEVTTGKALASILPILWMMAGCRGTCPKLPPSNTQWLLSGDLNFSLLLAEKGFVRFLEKLGDRTKIGDESPPLDYVFLVTDEDECFNVWRRQIIDLPWKGTKPVVVQLYKNYLDNFQLQLNSVDR